MKEKRIKIVIALFILMVIILGILFLLEFIDFYNDYKCSTSQDINWFMENNCMRYIEREIRNK